MGMALPRRLGHRFLLKADLHSEVSGLPQTGLLKVGIL